MNATSTSAGRSRTVGAALFSAAGSIPLHIAPLLIATLLASRSVSHTEAGSIVSCIMAGQILAAFLAAPVRFETLPRSVIAIVFCVYAGAVWVTDQTGSALVFAGAWVVTGLSCGFLMQFGMVTAARSDMKLQAFAWRLSFALFFSGLIAVCLPLTGNEPGYRHLILLFGCALLLIFAGGMALWRRGEAPAKSSALPQKDRLVKTDLLGLTLLFLFFTGLIGFQANAAHFTASNDFSLNSTALAIGLSKGLISIVILWVAVRGNTHSRRLQSLYSLALAAAAALIFTQQGFLVVLLGFIAFELFLNLSSASFMAVLSERFSSRAKTLLLTAVLFGTLSGPPLAGYLIDAGQTGLPLLLAAGAAFLPLFWFAYSRHVEQRPFPADAGMASSRPKRRAGRHHIN